MTNIKCIVLISLHIAMVQIIHTNSRTSYLWKLNSEINMIEPGNLQKLPYYAEEIFDDPIFNILVSTVHYGNSWTKKGSENYCTDCLKANKSQEV